MGLEILATEPAALCIFAFDGSNERCWSEHLPERSWQGDFSLRVSQGEVIVPVSINGSQPLRFVLDTGSTRTLIDRSVAARLGLKEREASSLQGAGQGRIPIYALPNVDFQMPGLQSKGYDCFAVDLAPVGKAVGTREDGILGYDFFARFVVTIDFETKQMIVETPAAFHPEKTFEELPLEIRGKWGFVKGELVREALGGVLCRCFAHARMVRAIRRYADARRA